MLSLISEFKSYSLSNIFFCVSLLKQIETPPRDPYLIDAWVLARLSTQS